MNIEKTKLYQFCKKYDIKVEYIADNDEFNKFKHIKVIFPNKDEIRIYADEYEIYMQNIYWINIIKSKKFISYLESVKKVLEDEKK